MATVSLFYRDGNNYKCDWETEIPDEVMRGLPAPDTDGQYHVASLGLEVTDIPLVADYGYDEESDHPFVTVTEVKYDDQWVPPTGE